MSDENETTVDESQPVDSSTTTSETPASDSAAEGKTEEIHIPGPRQVKLSVARIDPWSAMKLGLLLSVGLGIMMVIATAILWFMLDSMMVFDNLNSLLLDINNEQMLTMMEFLRLDRVLSMATIVAVVNVILLTALSALGAFLYNIVASLVGGLHVTLTDD